MDPSPSRLPHASRDDLGFDLRDSGFHNRALNRSSPSGTRNKSKGLVATFLGTANLTPGEMNRLSSHPGRPEAVVASKRVGLAALPYQVSWDVFASTATFQRTICYSASGCHEANEPWGLRLVAGSGRESARSFDSAMDGAFMFLACFSPWVC